MTVYSGMIEAIVRRQRRKATPTFKKLRRKIHTHIRIPPRSLPRIHRLRNIMRLNLLDFHQHAIPRAEPNYNLGHAQQKRLNPVLHELAVEIVHVPGGPDLRTSLELNPVNRLAGLGF